MEHNNYLRSQVYEGYIRLARLCERDDYRAHNSHMQNLLNADEGKNYTRYSRSWHLKDVKKAMIGATEHALRRRFAKEDKVIVQTYLERINIATAGCELLAICEEGVKLFLKYKPAI